MLIEQRIPFTWYHVQDFPKNFFPDTDNVEKKSFNSCCHINEL